MTNLFKSIRPTSDCAFLLSCGLIAGFILLYLATSGPGEELQKAEGGIAYLELDHVTSSTLSGAIAAHIHGRICRPETKDTQVKDVRLKASFFICGPFWNETLIGECATTVSLSSAEDCTTFALTLQTPPIEKTHMHWQDRMVVKWSYSLSGVGDNPSVELRYGGKTSSCVEIPVSCGDIDLSEKDRIALGVKRILRPARCFRTFFLTGEASNMCGCISGHMKILRYQRMTDHFPCSSSDYSSTRMTLPPKQEAIHGEYEMGRWISPQLGPWIKHPLEEVSH